MTDAYYSSARIDAAEKARRLAAWRCKGCNRGVADGATPNGRKSQETGKSRFCERCSRRVRLMRAHKRTPPLDMPSASSRGGRGDDKALRLYWERRIWDAGCEAWEVDTGEENDAVFREARTRFFALISLAARYLDPGVYIRDCDVPRVLGCSVERHINESER